VKRKTLPFLGGLLFGYIGAKLYVNRKKSTKELAKLHSKNPLQFLHGYVYFRWPELYLGIVKKVLENPEAVPQPIYDTCGNYLMETHHSKVLPIKEARKLVKVEEDISLTNLEQVIPFDRARDIILRDPGHIAVTDCMCRRIVKDPCLPLDVCLIIGEPFASFVVEHQPNNSRWITRDEAVGILEREHKRERFHTAWYKDAAGGRFYVICNCCGCCCMGMKAFKLFDKRVITSSGYTAEVNVDICDVCGACSGICSFEALKVNDIAEINSERCMGCGLCVEKCKKDAISLRLDPSKPKPLNITELT